MCVDRHWFIGPADQIITIDNFLCSFIYGHVVVIGLFSSNNFLEDFPVKGL